MPEVISRYVLLMRSVLNSNDVQTFVAAVKKYGSGGFRRLAIGNEVADSATNIMNKVLSIHFDVPFKCKLNPRVMQKVWDVRGYLQSIGMSLYAQSPSPNLTPSWFARY